MKSLLIVSAAALLMAASRDSVQSCNLTVHEWGTFTSVAGEDGSAIDWDALGCTTDLPRFVHEFGFRVKGRLRGTVRMETPVMYFYSAADVDAHVKVAFPKGLITEWYPQADHDVYQASRLDGSVRRLDPDMNGIDLSLGSVTGGIEWKNVKVRPDSSPTLPMKKGPSRYYAARDTDAASITIGGEHEKFLFYRGVGRFPVPFSARLSDDGRTVVTNERGEAVPYVFLFENHQGHAAYRSTAPVRGHDTVTIDPASGDAFQTLPHVVEKALVNQGLFPKEARAMIETWRDSWFEEGSRLIYILPSAAVDAMLPLEVEPTPAQSVRVFVGRIELVTPQVVRTVAGAVARNDRSIINRYGRFLDAILERIQATNTPSAGRVEQFRRNVQLSTAPGYCR